MAQKVNVVLVDDIDGSEASETVTFGLDGVSYEIDLSTDNAARLRNSLAGYVGSARKVGGTRKRVAAARGGSSGRSSGEVDTNSVREWARANGYQVADRGRIKADIVTAYQSATA